jgi:hypothetical protein
MRMEEITGQCPPPHRWKYVMGEWIRSCKQKNLGVKVGDTEIPCAANVDDTTLLAYSIEDMAKVKDFREVLETNGDSNGRQKRTSTLSVGTGEVQPYNLPG